MTGLRREVVGCAAGRVLEVGAGTGLNIPHYGNGVHELVLTEPEPTMARRLQRRARHAHLSAVVLTVFAERLPFDNASFDHVVVTLVLCTVASPAAALQEARRVLVDGGRFAVHRARSRRHGICAGTLAAPPPPALARLRLWLPLQSRHAAPAGRVPIRDVQNPAGTMARDAADRSAAGVRRCAGGLVGKLTAVSQSLGR
ncbi:MAG: class I SAM-dependent methyltransferase [Solirubrobacteraceae bacterium]